MNEYQRLFRGADGAIDQPSSDSTTWTWTAILELMGA
jgi:hypothetical protein